MNPCDGVMSMPPHFLASGFATYGFMFGYILQRFLDSVGTLFLVFILMLWPAYHPCDPLDTERAVLIGLMQIFTINVGYGMLSSLLSGHVRLVNLRIFKYCPDPEKKGHFVFKGIAWRTLQWYIVVGLISTGLVVQGGFFSPSHGPNNLPDSVALPLGWTMFVLGFLAAGLNLFWIYRGDNHNDKNNTKYLFYPLLPIPIAHIIYDLMSMSGVEWQLDAAGGITLGVISAIWIGFYYYHKILWWKHDFLEKHEVKRFIGIGLFMNLSITGTMMILDLATRDVFWQECGGSIAGVVGLIIIYVYKMMRGKSFSVEEVV